MFYATRTTQILIKTVVYHQKKVWDSEGANIMLEEIKKVAAEVEVEAKKVVVEVEAKAKEEITEVKAEIEKVAEEVKAAFQYGVKKL
jgi:hypothetical protein